MAQKTKTSRTIPNTAQKKRMINEQKRRKRERRIRKRLLILAVAILIIIVISKISVSGIKGIINMLTVNSPISRYFEKLDKSQNNTDDENLDTDWALILVNKDNSLPEDYKLELSSLRNGLEFDSRAINQLNSMITAAKEQGLSIVVCSAYRSVERQKELFENQVKIHMNNGLKREQAEAEAKKAVAYPGTSEHNLGLAVDLVSLSYQILDEAQEDTPEAKWLFSNCADYGFILRYPQGKSSITGVMYEPWHYRYVGVDTAKKIMESGVCLEEYLN